MVSDAQSRLVVGLVGGSHLVNHAYFMLLPPIFGPLRSDLGLTDAQLGVALGTVGVVVTALQLPFGSLSDSRSRTSVLAISLTFGAVGAILTATAQSYAWLLAASVVTGVGIAGHHPAHYPLIGAATTADTRGRAYSVHGFTGAIGLAAPPAIVATASTLGLDWRVAIGAIAIVGAVYGVVCLLAFDRLVREAITHPSSSGGEAAAAGATDVTDTADASLTTRIRRELGTVVSSPPILALTVLWFVSSMAGWGIKQYTATLLSSGYPVSDAAANFAVSAMLVTGAVLIFAGGWLTDRYSPGPVLVGGYAALVLVAGALALGTLPLVGALALVLVLSATVDGSRPARAALADAFSTDDSAGKNFGFLTIGISGGAAVAPPVLAVVVSRAGVAAAFWAVAGIGVLAVALTLVVLTVGGRRALGTAQPGD
ncbi:MFS transporter [Haloarcula nitratireducens]|uniref:MFS transporter n=1 Tax=Haloarcula nitratireducens TaxID=2487749 RepID=A0AAW4PA50_9EURY|nr:MFS transporter [Halomicroarcula nitratireducens]MBX0294683.1 MFS transporter [Halomicroarcula nitratireducens]